MIYIDFYKDINLEFSYELYQTFQFLINMKNINDVLNTENINKMIRYYLPRKTDMSKISQSDIYTIQEKLNNMPRKSLNYQSPNEVINNYLKSGAMKT